MKLIPLLCFVFLLGCQTRPPEPASVKGETLTQQVSRVLKKSEPELRNCFKTFAGQLLVDTLWLKAISEFRVRASGSIGPVSTRVKVEKPKGKKIKTVGLSRCIDKIIAEAKFPPQKRKTRDVNINLKFKMQNGQIKLGTS